MPLMDAPAYDPTHDRRMKALGISLVVLVIASFLIGFGGFALGHGWFFTNLSAEHKVDHFYSALEAKDYNTAYGIYENDPNWQQHPDKFGYPLKRFIEDWTTYSPISAPITSHHVDVSKTDGTGKFGTGIIVAAHVNGDKQKKIFLYVNRADGTLAESPHELQY